MAKKQYVFVQNLGQGSFGVVQKVFNVQENQYYALKRVKYMEMKQRSKRNALNQIRILSSIDHLNVIKYKQAFFEGDNRDLCTIMELAPYGDLAGKIKQKIKSYHYFPEKQIWQIGFDIINGIEALHKNNIIHRDIKPANIFFGERGIVKIGDLNVSIQMQEEYINAQTGTPFYASPQVWNNDLYSYDCDIWSFGCVLYQMSTLRKPFQSKDIQKLHKKIIKLNYDPLSSRYSQKLKYVISKCLVYKENRINIQELKQIFLNQLICKSSQNEYNADKIRQKEAVFKQHYKPFISQLNFCSQNPQNYGGQCVIGNHNEPALNKYLVSGRKLSNKKSLSKINSLINIRHYQNESNKLNKRESYGYQSQSIRNIIYKYDPVSPVQMDFRDQMRNRNRNKIYYY